MEEKEKYKYREPKLSGLFRFDSTSAYFRWMAGSVGDMAEYIAEEIDRDILKLLIELGKYREKFEEDAVRNEKSYRPQNWGTDLQTEESIRGP